MGITNKFKWLLFPLIVYLCFIGIYVGISYFNHNNYLFLPVWDVKHYLDISEIGYQVYPCTPGVDGNFGEICGNPGWFPMWPLVVKLFRPLFGGSSQTTFITLTFLIMFVGLILLYRLIERFYGFKAGLFTLIALILSPAGFYMLTGFPYALFLLLFMLYLFLLYAKPGWGRGVGLFIVAMMISLTYPTGILIAVMPLVWKMFSKETKFRYKSFRDWLDVGLYILPFFLGLVFLWIYFYIKFDDFFLQLHFQEKYHRTWAVPIYIIFKSFFTKPILSPENISIIWYGLIFVVFFPFRLKRELWILALVLYLFSLTTGTTMSIYRHYLIIFPFYMIIGVSDRPLWLKSAYCLIGLLLSIFVLFPLFMNYRLI